MALPPRSRHQGLKDLTVQLVNVDRSATAPELGENIPMSRV